jgi:hypothetical protein
VVVVGPGVVTPSIGVDVPVDVGVAEVPIDVVPVDVVSVYVTNITSVDISPIDVAGRSVSHSRPRAAPGSCDTGLGHAQPHATHEQSRKNYYNPSHSAFLFSNISFFQSTPLRELQSGEDS